MVSNRLANMPASLLSVTRFEKLDGLTPASIPALLAHPDWKTPAPVVVWLHGRSVNKELDPGRYLRWVRAGIGVCAIDLPGHGERFDEKMQTGENTLHVVEQAVREIDHVIEALSDPKWGGVFDLERSAIGGMSAGGMAALRRLCDGHDFLCAAVESTAGDFSYMGYADRFGKELTDALDPAKHLDGWRNIPLLALHSEADEWIPVRAMSSFVDMLRTRYSKLGADAGTIAFKTWPKTGAPSEHAGFGKVANEAKNIQVAFLEKWLLG